MTQDVHARFTYLQWKDEYAKGIRPIEVHREGYPDKTNMSWYQTDNAELVQDVRGRESEFKLDTHGFTFVKHNPGLTREEFKDRDQVTERYLPNTVELYKETFGDVDEVYIFHWQV